MSQQIYQWIILGVLVAFVAFDKAMKLLSGSENPGSKKIYLDKKIINHESRIAVNEEGIKGVYKIINGMKQDNKDDHKAIFKKFDEVIKMMNTRGEGK